MFTPSRPPCGALLTSSACIRECVSPVTTPIGRQICHAESPETPRSLLPQGKRRREGARRYCGGASEDTTFNAVVREKSRPPRPGPMSRAGQSDSLLRVNSHDARREYSVFARLAEEVNCGNAAHPPSRDLER